MLFRSNDTATTEIYTSLHTLSLHDALPIFYFAGAKDGPLERPIYRTRLDGGPIERVTPETGWHQATFSRDGRHFVDVHDSAALPPRVLLKDGSGKQVRIIEANADPEPKVLGLHSPEFVTLKVGGDIVLHGALYKPRVLEKGKKYPAIVRVYGGPTAQTVRGVPSLASSYRASART